MVNGRLKIATIGGGSSYTPELVEGFLKRLHELPVGELWLVDVEEGLHKQEIVTGLAERMAARAGADIRIVSTLDRRAALKDADFVTTQFRVGFLDAREKDERMPWDHIDSGVTKSFLWREKEKSDREETTKDCSQGCNGCGLQRWKGVCALANDRGV